MKAAALLSLYVLPQVVLFGLCEAIQLNFEYFDDSEPDSSDESLSNSSFTGGRISLFNILERSLRKNKTSNEETTTTSTATTTESPIEIMPIKIEPEKSKNESEDSGEEKIIKILESPPILENPKKFSRKEKMKFRLNKNRDKAKTLKTIEIEPVKEEEEEQREETTSPKPSRRIEKYNRERNQERKEEQRHEMPTFPRRKETTSSKRDETFKVVLPSPPRFPPMLAARVERERETLPIFLDEVDLDDFNAFRLADLQFGNKNGAESSSQDDLPPLKVFGHSSGGREREFLSSRAPPSPPPPKFEMKAKVRYAKRGAAEFSPPPNEEKIKGEENHENLNESGAARILVKTTKRTTTTEAPIPVRETYRSEPEEYKESQETVKPEFENSAIRKPEPESFEKPRSRDLETPPAQIPDDWRFSHLAPLPAPVITQVEVRPKSPPQQDQHDQFERNIEDLIRVDADHYRDEDPYERAFSEFPRLENNEGPELIHEQDQRDAFFGNEDEFEELLEPAPSSYGTSSYPEFEGYNF